MNYYELLNLDPCCTYNDIRRSFIRKIKAVHPDKTESADVSLHHLMNAYNILSDPVQRQLYDEYQATKTCFKQGYTDNNIVIQDNSENMLKFGCNQCGELNVIGQELLIEFNTIECISCCYKFAFDE